MSQGREVTMKTDYDLYEPLFERCFNNSFVALAILDKQFNFIRVNSTYAQLDKKEACYYVGINHFDLYPSDAKVFFETVVKTNN